MSAMTALQQSPGFARALGTYGADISLWKGSGPVILQRRVGPLGKLAFASRANPADVADSPVRILNGEPPCPDAYRAAGFRQIVTPVHIAEWDLTRAHLRVGLRGK